MTQPENQSDFDFEQHERVLSIRYQQLARYDAFDKLVDMALDGVIDMKDAQIAWESEEVFFEK